MNNESIQGESRRARFLGESQRHYSDPWGGGDQQGDEKKEGCIVIALAMGICVPLLVCITLYVVVATIAQAVIQIHEWVLR